MTRAAASELLARKMSGLETLIDLFYLLADRPAHHTWHSWIEFITTLIEHAVADGRRRDRGYAPPRLAAALSIEVVR
jgi:hypothetical protein